MPLDSHVCIKIASDITVMDVFIEFELFQHKDRIRYDNSDVIIEFLHFFCTKITSDITVMDVFIEFLHKDRIRHDNSDVCLLSLLC